MRNLAPQSLRQTFLSPQIRSISSSPSFISSNRYSNLSYHAQYALNARSPLSASQLPITRGKLTTRHAYTRTDVRPLSTETRSAIDKAVASAPVVLFMKGTPETSQCGFSRASIQILGFQGVDPGKFTAFNVLEDEELRQGIKEYSDWPTIPQLYVDKEFVGGCDILMSMHQDGSLAKLLEEKSVIVPAEEGKAE